MPESLYALAVLACPIGMGAMMWVMMRGQNKTNEDDTVAKQAELAALHAELDRLQAFKRDDQRTGLEGHASS